MLTFDAEQFRTFERNAGLGFVLRLTDRLAATEPTAFTGQPAFVRRLMVVNGLAMAAGYGFSLESTLGGFVALQCETAADFHCHPLMHAILQSGTPERQRFDRLIADVPASTWNVVKRGADLRAWFEPKSGEQQVARITALVCSTFPELHHRFRDAELLRLIERAIGEAKRHGVAVESGIAVYASALAVYGEELDAAAGPAWAAAIFRRAGLSSERQVALLRLRLLLDTDRLI